MSKLNNIYQKSIRYRYPKCKNKFLRKYGLLADGDVISATDLIKQYLRMKELEHE